MLFGVLADSNNLEDHSAEEIARETGIPKPSVKSMLSGAKAKLIRILKKTGHEAQ